MSCLHLTGWCFGTCGSSRLISHHITRTRPGSKIRNLFRLLWWYGYPSVCGLAHSLRTTTTNGIRSVVTESLEGGRERVCGNFGRWDPVLLAGRCRFRRLFLLDLGCCPAVWAGVYWCYGIGCCIRPAWGDYSWVDKLIIQWGLMLMLILGGGGKRGLELGPLWDCSGESQPYLLLHTSIYSFPFFSLINLIDTKNTSNNTNNQLSILNIHTSPRPQPQPLVHASKNSFTYQRDFLFIFKGGSRFHTQIKF